MSPGTDHVVVGGVRVARGSKVRMRPGARRADAQDFFLAGRDALVEAVLFDVDGQAHLALTPEDDPAAPAGAAAIVRRRNSMIKRLIKAGLLAAVLALVIQSLPDIKRYLDLREM